MFSPLKKKEKKNKTLFDQSTKDDYVHNKITILRVPQPAAAVAV